MRTASPLGFVLSHMRIRKEKPLRYEALTGLTRGQLTEVAARVATAIGGVARPGGRPAAVGLFRSVGMAVTLMGSGANSVIVLPGVEDDAFAEQGESGAAVHLAFEHLEPVDVALDHARAPGQGQAVAHGVVVVPDVPRSHPDPR